MNWLGAALLVGLLSGPLVMLVWIARREDRHAGIYFAAAGALMTLDGVASLLDHAPDLALYASDIIAPVVGWLIYRGAAAFADRPPHRGAFGLMLVSVGLWIAASATGWSALRMTVGLGIAALFLGASVPILLRRAETAIQRAFALSWIVAIGLLGLRPLNEFGVVGRETELQLWFITVAGFALLTVCALLERATVDARALAEQRAEQLRLSAIVGGLGTWVYEPETGRLEWSEELHDLYQLPREEAPPGPQRFAELVDPADRERYDAAFGRIVAEQDGSLDIEYKAHTVKGEPRYLRTRALRMRGPDGRNLVVGTTIDVTAHRGALEELRHYRTHLEELVEQRTTALEASRRRLLEKERLASIGTLTAGLAHQVNNPVGSILAAADFAGRCRGDDDELELLRRSVADIENEARRCGEIVRDMLRFASDRPTDKKPVEVDRLLTWTRDSLRRVGRDAGATIEIELEGPSPTIQASAIEIEQALTNLVENALQSGDPGLHVRLCRRTLSDRVVLEVSDDGEGISADSLGRVLDPFYTTRLSEGGTGLGLSVAHGIARAHGGDLSIQSTPGEGTTVRLTLPRAA